MNIFFLDFDPKKCAIMYVNSHTVKMILESVQLLCSAHHMCGSINPSFIIPYKLTHKNHPSAKWTRESLSNYKWLVELTKELCTEYTYRYEKIHKCESEGYLKDLENNLPNIQDIGFTFPAQAMPEMYKSGTTNMEDVIYAYKDYYYFEKSHLFQWKKRSIPEFIMEYDNMFN